MTVTQVVILIVIVLLFLAGGIASVAQLAGRKVRPAFRWVCLLGGIALCLALLVMHSVTTPGRWQPLQDNLSAMLTLCVILAGFVAYLQARRPVPSLEWIVMPAVIVLLLMAGHFGTTKPEAYLPTTYSVVHRITTYLGTIAFVAAGATGVLYLMADRNLRHKAGGPRPGRFGSLERLGHLTYSAVTLGFALFTVGCISGIAWAIHERGGGLGERWYFAPKVILAFAVWLIFAVVLNTPIAPRLRGRKMAILSIFGVILAMATLTAVLFMSGGQ